MDLHPRNLEDVVAFIIYADPYSAFLPSSDQGKEGQERKTQSSDVMRLRTIAKVTMVNIVSRKLKHGKEAHCSFEQSNKFLRSASG
jgi:hypothetical protein